MDQGGHRVWIRGRYHHDSQDGALWPQVIGSGVQSKVTGVLHDIGYTPSKSDPDVWLSPAVKPYGAEYYEMLLCCVNDVLAISDMRMRMMEGNRSVFKIKDDKTEVPDVFLGATLSQVETETDTKCWSMSSEKYIKATIENLESKLGKSDMHLPKCRTPMSMSYHPSKDVTK